MLRSNTWHEGYLDTKMCWKYFKYKLVLDDIRNKLKRDCAFLKAAIGREMSIEPEQPRSATLNVPSNGHPCGPYDGTSSSSPATINTSTFAEEESAASSNDHDSPGTDLHQIVSIKTRPNKEWIIPCSLATVQKRIQQLLRDREHLDGPLMQINDMVRSPLAPNLYKAYNFTSIHEAEFASASSHNSEYLAILATLFLPISLLSVLQWDAS